MNIKKALEIIENFKILGTKGIIRRYPKEELKQVLPGISKIDRESRWYKEMLKYLYKEDKKWWHDPLFLVLVSVFGTAFCSYLIANHFLNRQKAELSEVQLILADKNKQVMELKEEIQTIRNRKPEIPVTVVDKATGNQIYIDRPLARPTHYEFPIILNDGQGSYRIDQYNILNQFKGALIIKKRLTPD